jgi:hypothetical protein
MIIYVGLCSWSWDLDLCALNFALGALYFERGKHYLHIEAQSTKHKAPSSKFRTNVRQQDQEFISQRR